MRVTLKPIRSSKSKLYSVICPYTFEMLSFGCGNELLPLNSKPDAAIGRGR
jgi:hypothetical protein